MAGVEKADTHIHMHGEGGIHHTPRVRLHWGDEDIDEEHDCPITTVLVWSMAALASKWPPLTAYMTGWMQSSMYDWMTSVGVSSDAWLKRASFAAALRRAWGVS